MLPACASSAPAGFHSPPAAADVQQRLQQGGLKGRRLTLKLKRRKQVRRRLGSACSSGHKQRFSHPTMPAACACV